MTAIRSTARKLTVKLVIAGAWITATPVLAVPYILAVLWLVVEPGSGQLGPGSTSDYLAAAAVFSAFSIYALPWTGPLVGITSLLVKPLLESYLSRFWRGVFFATLVGWLHCTAFLVLREAQLIGEFFFT
jgi:hypothetical protein